MQTMSINHSSSKQLFSFSKDERFKSPKPQVDVSYDYEGLSQFNSTNKKSGEMSPFGSTIRHRFEYVHMKKKAQLPPPS